MYAALGELFYGVICREQSIQPAIGQLAGRQRQSSSMVQLAGNSKSCLLWGNLPASNVRAGLRRNLSGTVNPAFWGGFTGKQCSSSSMGQLSGNSKSSLL